MKATLLVTEIYTSIQGESTWAGTLCTFVRLTGCPLRCRWCDTTYGFKGGHITEVDKICEEVKKSKVPIVEITGGEPLAQKNTPLLAQKLIDMGHTVLIETSGSENVSELPKEVHIIMDLKCPNSKMSDKNRYENLEHLKPSDEIKFVIDGKDDFDWAVGMIREYQLGERFTVLMSPAFGLTKPQELVEWMLDHDLNYRLNLQLHKYIWHPRKKGV